MADRYIRRRAFAFTRRGKPGRDDLLLHKRPESGRANFRTLYPPPCGLARCTSNRFPLPQRNSDLVDGICADPPRHWITLFCYPAFSTGDDLDSMEMRCVRKQGVWAGCASPHPLFSEISVKNTFILSEAERLRSQIEESRFEDYLAFKPPARVPRLLRFPLSNPKTHPRH